MQKTVRVNGKDVEINGTIRSKIPQCLKKVWSNIQGYPFTSKR